MLRNYVILFFSIITFSQLFGQNGVPCPYVDAGPDQIYGCAQTCSNLTGSFFDIKETTSYTVESIPHTPPINYGAAGGTGVSVNTDDVWSGVINLPFPFCFYGTTYNSLLIGSNGDLNFNVASASGGCPWSYTATCPSTALVNAGQVFGVYHDIDPSVCGNIKWYLTGTAPCRQFIVVFDNICHFSCTSKKSKHMMVLNETTNYIDVYVTLKETCSSWNGGRAIIGIQNLAGTAGITAPGRNSNVNWTVTTPEAWRFKPAGDSLYSFQWFQDTTLIGTSTTINVCPTQTTTYTAKFTYTPCGDTIPVTLTDDVTVTPPASPLVFTSTPTPSICLQANGSVQLHATGGAGAYAFSNDNINFAANSNFTGLSAGTYNFYVRDTANCNSTLSTVVLDSSTLTGIIDTVINPVCSGLATGQIDLLADLGTPPYSYIIGNGTPQNTPSFTGLTAGTYQLTVQDSEGCTVPLSATITEPTSVQISLDSVASTTCNLPNGTFIVSTIGGTGTYMYSVDTFLNVSTTGIFENTYPGYFFINVADSNGCTDTMTVFVPAEPAVSASITTYQNPSCTGFSDGSFSVNAWGGPTPYTYTFNGATGSNASFTGLSAGPQNVVVTDSLGCQSSATIILADPPLLTVSIDPTTVVCAGTQVTLNAVTTGGTPPYLYVWNTVLPGNPLNVSPNATTDYSVLVQDSHGCDTTATITQQILPVPVATATASPNSGFAPLSVSFTNTSTNANTYAWDFGNGQTALTTTLQSTNALYADTGTYNVTMIASNGICESSWNQIISVVPLLVVEAPNVFTPNDDNANDGYQLIMRNATGIEATIFNRWGEVMVKISDVNYKWDGKNKSGAKASEGVYFIKYHVTGPNNQEFEGQTFFHLVR